MKPQKEQPQGIAPTNRYFMVTTKGNHKGLPLHKNIVVILHKNIVVGAILYGCPE